MMYKCQTNAYVCWLVQSDSNVDKFYLVEFNAKVLKDENFAKVYHGRAGKSSWIEGWRCECPAFQHRRTQCKHIVRRQVVHCKWDQGTEPSKLKDAAPVRTSDSRLRCPVCSSDVVAYQEQLQVVDENVGF